MRLVDHIECYNVWLVPGPISHNLKSADIVLGRKTEPVPESCLKRDIARVVAWHQHMPIDDDHELSVRQCIDGLIKHLQPTQTTQARVHCRIDARLIDKRISKGPIDTDGQAHAIEAESSDAERKFVQRHLVEATDHERCQMGAVPVRATEPYVPSMFVVNPTPYSAEWQSVGVQVGTSSWPCVIGLGRDSPNGARDDVPKPRGTPTAELFHDDTKRNRQQQDGAQ
mmetsp:Transcript_95328/g.269500  ORF Transcript_95328/g.269500 Transcript_95328/m.269500 type:complete len:226 (+) Transcript_95328:1395-2072(+)